MNEATSATKKAEFSPPADYVMEKALLIATSNHLHVRQAVKQVLDAIELLNARLYPTTDEPR